MAEYARTVTARKAYWCEDHNPGALRHSIPAGKPYVRVVVFPDGDINNRSRPWVMRLCGSCYTRYGKTMPPAPTRKAKR